MKLTWEEQFLPEDCGKSNGVYLLENGLPIASLFAIGDDKKKASDIVKRVNSHDLLLMAAEEALLILKDTCTERQQVLLGVFDILETAIKNAKE